MRFKSLAVIAFVLMCCCLINIARLAYYASSPNYARTQAIVTESLRKHKDVSCPLTSHKYRYDYVVNGKTHSGLSGKVCYWGYSRGDLADIFYAVSNPEVDIFIRKIHEQLAKCGVLLVICLGGWLYARATTRIDVS